MPKKESSLLILTGLTFLVSAFIFSGIFIFNIETDLQGHIYGLTVTHKNHSFPIPPLYYLLIDLLSGFTLNINALFVASTVLLSIAVSLKYYYSTRYIQITNENIGNPLILNIAIWLLLFATPVLYQFKQIVVGRFPPNVWHNSTTIFLMPFAFLLYQKTYLIVKTKKVDKNDVWAILLLGIINLLIKPSFLFPLIPAVLSMALFTTGIKSELFKRIFFISIILSVLICLEYYSIYKLGVIDAVRFKNDVKGIEINPFYSLLFLCNNNWGTLGINALVSLAFPITFFILYPKEIRKESELKYVVLIFLFSLLIGIFLNEKGAMGGFGNFLWQLYIANYLLFFVIIKILYERIMKFGLSTKTIFLLALFGLHVFSGFFYLLKMFYLKSYL